MLLVLAPIVAAVPQTEVVEVELKRSRRRPAIEAWVDAEPLTLLVDLGTRLSSLRADVAVSLGVVCDEDPGDPHAHVDSLVLGDIDLGAWRPRVDSESGPDEPHGTLARDILERYLLTLDLSRGRLRLEKGELPPPDGASIVPTACCDESITFSVVAGPWRLDAHLVSLVQAELGLHPREVDDFPLVSEPRPVGRLRRSAGAPLIRASALDGVFELGELVVPNVGIHFCAAFDHPVLGLHAFEGAVLTLDFANARARVSRAEPELGLGLEAGDVPPLDRGLYSLADTFERDHGRPRLLAVLSPTCPGCIAGARLVQHLLEESPDADVAAYCVWLPKLGSDHRDAALEAKKLLVDPRFRHFWDEERKVARAFGRVLPLPDGRREAWDVYMVFDADATWTERLPDPTVFRHQLGADERRLGDGEALRRALMGD